MGPVAPMVDVAGLLDRRTEIETLLALPVRGAPDPTGLLEAMAEDALASKRAAAEPSPKRGPGKAVGGKAVGGKAVGLGGVTAGMFALSACAGGSDGSDGGFGGGGGLGGNVVKDPVQGALVFQDRDDDGALDPDEPSVVTDANGRYFFPTADGRLVAVGGIDAATGSSLDGATFLAGADATVVSPLTTLGQILGDEALVRTAFGLSPDVDLEQFDPIAALAADPGDAVAQAVLAADRMSALLMLGGSELAGGDFLGFADVFARQIEANGATDLSDPAALSGILVAAGVAADVAAIAGEAIGQVNARMAAAGADFDDPGVLGALAVGESLLRDALERLAGDPDAAGIAAFRADFTGGNLDALLDAGQALIGEGFDDILAAIDNYRALPGETLTIAPGDDDYLTANDTDLAGGTLTVTGVAVDPANAGDVDVDLDPDTGAVTVTPIGGFIGFATFSYTVENETGDVATGRALVRVSPDRSYGSDADDAFDGTDGTDVVAGLGGADTIAGRGGDDLIVASEGADAIDGGNGDDILVAANADGAEVLLRGGSGDDVFAVAQREAGADIDVLAVILDFAGGEDRIDLSDLRTADGGVLSFDDMAALFEDVDGDTTIDLSGFSTSDGAAVEGRIELLAVAPEGLAADDFVFADGFDWQTQVGDLPAPQPVV